MTSPSVRRRAMLRLGVLAGLLLLAGALPWLAGGPLAVRLIALPLLVTGALMGAAIAGLRTLPPAGRATAPPAGAARPAAARPARPRSARTGGAGRQATEAVAESR